MHHSLLFHYVRVADLLVWCSVDNRSVYFVLCVFFLLWFWLLTVSPGIKGNSVDCPPCGMLYISSACTGKYSGFLYESRSSGWQVQNNICADETGNCHRRLCSSSTFILTWSPAGHFVLRVLYIDFGPVLTSDWTFAIVFVLSPCFCSRSCLPVCLAVMDLIVLRTQPAQFESPIT